MNFSIVWRQTTTECACPSSRKITSTMWANEYTEKVLKEVVGVVMALEFVLKCLIVLVVLFGSVLLVKI